MIPWVVVGTWTIVVLIFVGSFLPWLQEYRVFKSLALEINREKSRRNCLNCERAGHDADAKFCKYCGAEFS